LHAFAGPIKASRLGVPPLKCHAISILPRYVRYPSWVDLVRAPQPFSCQIQAEGRHDEPSSPHWRNLERYEASSLVRIQLGRVAIGPSDRNGAGTASSSFCVIAVLASIV
jgi:hypothetical protein